MLRPLWLTGVLALALAAPAAEPGFKTQFIGGTPPGLPPRSGAHLDFAGDESLRIRCGKTELAIAYNKINVVEYGQNVSRRYAAAILISPVLLLSKARKHFVTIGYADANGRQQTLVLRVHKGDIRPVLAALETRTGRRIECQDEEARRWRKG
jgi:hypothetical protein